MNVWNAVEEKPERSAVQRQIRLSSSGGGGDGRGRLDLQQQRGGRKCCLFISGGFRRIKGWKEVGKEEDKVTLW